MSHRPDLIWRDPLPRETRETVIDRAKVVEGEPLVFAVIAVAPSGLVTIAPIGEASERARLVGGPLAAGARLVAIPIGPRAEPVAAAVITRADVARAALAAGTGRPT